MKYYSTRDKNCRVSAAQAIAQGLSSDGGLFVPEAIPAVSLSEIEALCKMDYRGRAVAIMGLYLEEFSQDELSAFVRDAYSDNYDSADIAPTRFLDGSTALLEL